MPSAFDDLLLFTPIFRRYLWGGRRLATMFGRPLGAGDDYAESWEIVDHGADQSIVGSGPLAGRTLHELVVGHGPALLGRHAGRASFPLLLKLLDCNRTLSVQVHPDDAQAARLDPPDLGKTEAWVVLAADPGSKIYAGLKPGVDRASLAAAVAAGRCEECLFAFEPRAGDCVFIPAGTVHALGAGLVIAEIQQASDTTFRLFDWNRTDAQGKPRQLHIDESLAVADFVRGPVGPQTPQPTGQSHRTRLVDCDKFVLDRLQGTGKSTLGGDDRCHILVVEKGAVQISGPSGSQRLIRGATALLPAAAQATAALDGGASLLDVVIA
jgi:mannose-6-phosphate isomerase